jgi:predicted glycoside hydrolase/deacetylase ChbG (UPF0249 family)
MSAALRALGFGPGERVVILHADDIGMCQASVSAFVDLARAGILSSASVMAPCPWFPRVAAFCRQHPQVDVGVHLTLTSEWRGYRWGPISTRDPASGMLDEDGYFFRDPRDLLLRGRPREIAAEMRAQLDRALAAGIDVTHIDSHMFSALFPALLAAYIELALEYNLPCLTWMLNGHPFSFTSQDVIRIQEIVRRYQENGLIPIDHVLAIHYTDPENPIPEVKLAIDALQPGVTHYLIHPSQDSPELRDISVHWRHRVADYEVFRDPRIGEYINSAGVRVVSYRDFRNAMRKEMTAEA